ncbi:MAG: DUF4912 domain-containing protein [Polyangiaceae bacterium]
MTARSPSTRTTSPAEDESAPAGTKNTVNSDSSAATSASKKEGGAAAPAGTPALSEAALAAGDGAGEASAAQSAEAPPAELPARYDVDEVVAIAVDPSTFYVYWEVRPTTFAHLVATSPGGALALRVTAVTPGWDGPIVETRDLVIDALYGDRFVHHVRPRADVRVSIGWLHDGAFDPIAVGAEVSAPRAFVAAGAPAPSGAPLDLSEGPGRSTPFSAPPSTGALVQHLQRAAAAGAAEKLAAGLVPRELHGVVIEGAPMAGPGPAGWVWAPFAGGPLRIGPSMAGAPTFTDDAGTEWFAAEDGTWWTVTEGTWWSTGDGVAWEARTEGGVWGGASEGGRWGGSSAGGRWGGASERRVRWGGASARWGGASERLGGASERHVRWGGASLP